MPKIEFKCHYFLASECILNNFTCNVKQMVFFVYREKLGLLIPIDVNLAYFNFWGRLECIRKLLRQDMWRISSTFSLELLVLKFQYIIFHNKVNKYKIVRNVLCAMNWQFFLYGWTCTSTISQPEFPVVLHVQFCTYSDSWISPFPNFHEWMFLKHKSGLHVTVRVS